ncbi:CCR4-NOT core DEDD family RNase subunit [Martiniozyma asiatica (nom. inval.)]|nr:CCR4-NOT core DEDD family RNase subunit [Martiniozyma asiatica]
MSHVQVYESTLDTAMATITALAPRYNHYFISTEFGGVVCRPMGSFRSTQDYHYQTLRSNVDLLELLQLTITVADSQGHRPTSVPHTYTFNFKFDPQREMYQPENIEALVASGVNIARAAQEGIPRELFAEGLLCSGALSGVWVSAHAGYDFGFLLGLLSSRPLAPNYEAFAAQLEKSLGNYWDVKWHGATDAWQWWSLRGEHKIFGLAL